MVTVEQLTKDNINSIINYSISSCEGWKNSTDQPVDEGGLGLIIIAMKCKVANV